MATRIKTARHQSDRELLLIRVFDAPPALVFKAWTDPGHLAQWLGPKGYTCPECELDVRPGGAFRACIHSSEGKVHWMRGIYKEIVPPTRLVFTFAWEDENGNPVHETLVTLSFEVQGKKTKQTFHQALFRTAQECDDHRGGWSESLDRLENHLATMRET